MRSESSWSVKLRSLRAALASSNEMAWLPSLSTYRKRAWSCVFLDELKTKNQWLIQHGQKLIRPMMSWPTKFELDAISSFPANARKLPHSWSSMCFHFLPPEILILLTKKLTAKRNEAPIRSALKRTFVSMIRNIYVCLLHQSHNAPVPYPTMQHFVTDMYTHVHFCYKIVHCGIYMSKVQCRRKTFMVHRTFVWWALKIPSHLKCPMCPTFFAYSAELWYLGDDGSRQSRSTGRLCHTCGWFW